MPFARSLRLAGALLALAALPAAAQRQQAAAEPAFDNRPLSAWIADLGAEAPYTRTAAAYAIASMGAAGKPAVPALVKNLSNENNAIRYSAALALGEIGPEAREAVDSLKVLLDDRSDDVAHIARKALRKITGEAVE